MTRASLHSTLDRVVYWGLMGQIILLPLAHTATLLWLVTSATAVAFLLKAFTRGIKFSPTPSDLPFALFVFATLVSAMYSVDVLETLDQIRSDVIIPVANFYLAAWGLSRREQLSGLGRAAVVIIGVLAGYGILHFFYAGGSLTSYLYRESSLAEDYHYLGTYLVVVFPVVLIVAISDALKSWRWLARGVALITPLAVYITFDRGCWLALAFIGLAVHPFFVKRKKIYLAGLAAATLIVVLFIPSGVLVHGKWIGVYHGRAIEANTLSQRLVVWTYCWRCLVENPWTGIGFGRENFKLAFPEFVHHYAKFQLFHCHNSYFDLALQIGIFGLVAFAIMAFTGIRMSYAIWSRAGPAKLWGAAGFFCLGGFLVRLLWDSLYMDEHARVLWLVLGAVFAAHRLLGEGGPEAGR